MRLILLICCGLLLLTADVDAQRRKRSAPDTTAAETPAYLQPSTYGALRWRSIGPAVTSGRIADFAVNPDNRSEYYVATAAGGVWKTVNHGVTYEPLFDNEGSYSIGCVSLDPSDSQTVWVGTGENNNQRSVNYGDGVYKSVDGGKRWKNMGLKNSEHIANVLVDPTDSDVVWVAAYGPLWSNGGERGVYKSTDGGETWEASKQVSDYTGCNDLRMDPRDPNVLYAAFHQRQRKVFTYLGGGPESGLYKTTDGGATWMPLKNGLPGGDLGRIGIDVSPANPDVVYAVVEAPDGKGGIYRSDNGGASWAKQSGTFTSGNYYQELTCDPRNVDRIFLADTYYKVSDDGGKTVRNLGELNKHVDNHAIWVDPSDTDHLLVGCDGGIYESWDFASTWHFKPNLPVTQFYKVTTDQSGPFYHVHGGTQDNLSLGGPNKNTSINGVLNSDWYVTSTGDGFETQVDPTDPNIIYAQSQYGGLSRFDRRSGEYLPIKPVEGEGENALRWNWDAPLTISQHQPTRLYFGANRVYRTDDRGNSWTAISPDLTRGIDRNTLPVMDRVWSVDAVAKNGSTSIFGQTTTIAESGIDPDLLWVGTDDGLLHKTTDGGDTWTAYDNLPGVPEMSYVNQVIASLHDRNTAYVAYNHHRYGDFAPYLLKTTDGGATWTSIASTLPERGSVYTVAEDHEDPNLLFCGTEFGAFFSPDAGEHWIALRSGLPTIAVRDIEIQRGENDVVIGTFGRGFYVLDDYSPLRNLGPETFAGDAVIFASRDPWLYVQRTPIGLRDKGHLGSSLFRSDNPDYGAAITYYVREAPKTLRAQRQERERAIMERKESVYYPSIDSLRLEQEQEDPFFLVTVSDAEGRVIRQLKRPATSGMQRFHWDLRYPPAEPVNSRYTPAPDVLFGSESKGQLVTPGTYTLRLRQFFDGEMTDLAGPVSFDVKYLDEATFPTQDWGEYRRFTGEVAALTKAVSALGDIRRDLDQRVSALEKAALETTNNPETALTDIYAIKGRLADFTTALYGDRTLSSLEIETPPSVAQRIGSVKYGMWDVTSAPTTTYRDNIRIASAQLPPLVEQLRGIERSILSLEGELEQQGAPYTPGRWPTLGRE
ncbi:WD40/YVTN/BNR-like repeat-containing protein [Lewinella sp. IMCC34183]|uniref:WD40/YVTN/BNR-like repeat-containing protein n=1 Tax=Lewinella sp. IMCC34183 TaxID=2248762 RepID=UPI000E25C4A2|nr:glycosyl hydrolase [Lewinella sp. IMCC34183]